MGVASTTTATSTMIVVTTATVTTAAAAATTTAAALIPPPDEIKRGGESKRGRKRAHSTTGLAKVSKPKPPPKPRMPRGKGNYLQRLINLVSSVIATSQTTHLLPLATDKLKWSITTLVIYRRSRF